ncbi:MAG: heme-dependent oxidative N-demethylase subunit alpha family protein [Planctomycetota bacterium]
MPQPRYFPFLHGVYDVKAGIEPLGRDHGNGDIDGRVFQFDEHFPTYRSAKSAAMRSPGRHVLCDRFAPEAERAVARWVVERLAAEYPTNFVRVDGRLLASLTGESLALDEGACALDALAMQVQCDWAVLVLDDDDRAASNRLAYLHVAMPSGWAPEEKIGKPFDVVHAPVPHIEPLNAKQSQIARLMVHATRGAVRFAWTITTDPDLNHHPLANPAADGVAHIARNARDVAPTVSQPFPRHTLGDPLLRVERQVIWGFPEHRVALFTIRTYRYTLADLDAHARSALAAAVGGMSDASLRYKNMDRGAILAWLGR